MSVIKIFIRSIIFSIVFTCFKFIVDVLMNLVLKKELIDLGTYRGITPEFSFNDYFMVFLLVSIPLLLSALIFNFFIKDLISKIFYWIIAALPILIYAWFSLYVISYGGMKGFLLFFSNSVFLFIAFYYNYRMINKELEKYKN
jgi:hypothetical protein